MTSSARWYMTLAALVIGIALGVWLDRIFQSSRSTEPDAHETQSDQPAGEDQSGGGASGGPIATVRVARVVTGDIVQSHDAYGSVTHQPGAAVVAQLQSEVIVKRVLVLTGQEVHQGDPLCEIELSPSTKAQLELARADLDSTSSLLQTAQEKQRLNLGTRQDLLQAETAQREAQLKLAQLEATLPDQSGMVRASNDGTVTEIHVETGTLASAGTPLMHVLVNNALVIHLGVQPADALHLRAGHSVPIQPVDARSEKNELTATVRVISPSVDPTSRLVNVVLDPPASPNASLRLGQTIRATIETKSTGAMIVPRSAVLPKEDQHIVFTVQDGHAHQHIVQIGLQNHDQVQIFSSDLKPGDVVITLGNYELEDGMAVRVENGA